MNIFRRHKLYTQNITCLCNCVINEHLLDTSKVYNNLMIKCQKLTGLSEKIKETMTKDK